MLYMNRKEPKMRKSKKAIADNYEKAVKIYEEGGQYRVYDAVNDGVLTCDKWEHCEPCEDKTPFEDNTCLVCGTYKKIII